jgi:hypothetical protein
MDGFIPNEPDNRETGGNGLEMIPRDIILPDGITLDMVSVETLTRLIQDRFKSPETAQRIAEIIRDAVESRYGMIAMARRLNTDLVVRSSELDKEIVRVDPELMAGLMIPAGASVVISHGGKAVRVALYASTTLSAGQVEMNDALVDELEIERGEALFIDFRPMPPRFYRRNEGTVGPQESDMIREEELPHERASYWGLEGQQTVEDTNRPRQVEDGLRFWRRKKNQLS